MRALAIAQIGGQDELIARVLAGRGVSARGGRAPSRSDLARSDARPVLPRATWRRRPSASGERSTRGERVAIFGDYDVDGACSAALLSEYLNACGCETIVHIPDRVTEGYGPNAEAMARLRGAGRQASSSRSIAARSATSRSSSRARLGLDVIVFDHHQAPGDAAARRWRWSIPTARTIFPASAISAPRASSIMALVALNRALREAGFWNGAPGARSDRRARSRRAGDGRRRRAADRPQPRLRRQGACGHAPARAGRGSRRCSTSPAPTDRRGPITWAFSSVRASTPADASATRRSASAC